MGEAYVVSKSAVIRGRLRLIGEGCEGTLLATQHESNNMPLPQQRV
jgi:hypothetical protein